jgi:hypothetical protein
MEIVIGALLVGSMACCVVWGLLFIARRGLTRSRTRYVVGCIFGLVLTIRMLIFDNNRGFAFLFFPALILIGTNAILGMRAYFKVPREGRA